MYEARGVRKRLRGRAEGSRDLESRRPGARGAGEKLASSGAGEQPAAVCCVGCARGAARSGAGGCAGELQERARDRISGMFGRIRDSVPSSRAGAQARPARATRSTARARPPLHRGSAGIPSPCLFIMSTSTMDYVKCAQAMVRHSLLPRAVVFARWHTYSHPRTHYLAAYALSHSPAGQGGWARQAAGAAAVRCDVCGGGSARARAESAAQPGRRPQAISRAQGARAGLRAAAASRVCAAAGLR